MNNVIAVDSRGFTAFLQELQKMSGLPFPEVLRSQTTAVLATCIRYSPSINLGRAKATVDRQLTAKFNTYGAGGRASGGKDHYLAGKVYRGAGGVNPRISRSTISARRDWLRQDGVFYHMGGAGEKRRWSDKRWKTYTDLEAERKAALENEIAEAGPRLRKSRGLGKHSWWQVIVDLGLENRPEAAKVSKWVKVAAPANGKQYKNGFGQEERGSARIFHRIINSSPIALSRGQGADILQRAIAARLSAFQKGLRAKVFDNVKTRAQRYPGLFVRP